MARTIEICNACGSHAVPKGARFCPACGSAFGPPNNNNTIPMVTAVPVEVSSDYLAPAAATALVPVEQQETALVSGLTSSTRPNRFDKESNNSINDCNNHNNSSSNSSNNNNAETATFWKSPSKAMLKHATDHQTMGSILFKSSSGCKGKFIVPQKLHVGQILAGENIDLSIADFVHPISTISVGNILGAIQIIVPRGVRVETYGIGILGGFKGIPSQTVRASEADDAPLVIVRGLSILGRAKVVVNHEVPPVKVVETKKKKSSLLLSPKKMIQKMLRGIK